MMDANCHDPYPTGGTGSLGLERDIAQDYIAFQSPPHWTTLTPLFTLVTQMAWAHK